MSDIRKWSDEHLDKEIMFAVACQDDADERTVNWTAKLQAEIVRRETVDA